MQNLIQLSNNQLSAKIHRKGCSLYQLQTSQGFTVLQGFKYPNQVYGGAIIAPCCGRIANGKARIGNMEAFLSQNEKKHHLHGGHYSTALSFWELLDYQKTSAYFVISLKSGTDGYPGNRQFFTRITLDYKKLILEIEAVTDCPTIVNPTSHAYWNLNANARNSVENHQFTIPASWYFPTNSELIALEPASVEQTSFDFRQTRSLSEAIGIGKPAKQIEYARGINHGWNCSTLSCHGDRASLKVSSDSDDIWLYSGGFIDKSVTLQDGSAGYASCAFAIEPQNVNRPSLLCPGEKFSRTIVFDLDW